MMNIQLGAPLIACRIVEEMKQSATEMGGGLPADMSEAAQYWDINEFGVTYAIRLLGTDDKNILVDYFNEAQGIVNAFLRNR